MIHLQMLFVKKLATCFAHLLCLTGAVYSRPGLDQSLLAGIKPTAEPADNVDIARFKIVT